MPKHSKGRKRHAGVPSNPHKNILRASRARRKKPMRRGRVWKNCARAIVIANGLMNVCQTGCATSSGNCINDPIVIEIRPPAALLEPCKMPEPEDVEMNGDILDILINQYELMRICAGKIDAIINFYGGNHGSSGSH